MANTITYGPNITTVSFDGATAFTMVATSTIGGVQLLSVTYKAAVANNSAVIRHDTSTGARIFDRADAGIGVQQVYNRMRLRPFVVGNEISNGDILIFEYE